MSTSQVVVSFGSSVIALLGGGGVVLVAICGFLSKFVADRTIEGHKAALNVELERVKSDLAKESEAHKLKLRKAELLFERELQAASEFTALYHRIRPDYSRPDMEWEDACDAVAARFPSIEKDLEAFLVKHGAVLTATIREKLREAVAAASHNKFGAYEMEVDQADAQARAAGGRVLDALAEGETLLFDLVKNEAHLPHG